MRRFLEHLHHLFDEEEEAATRDNAAGAVCRIVHVAGSMLPLPQILPAIVQALPLRGDVDEAEAVYGCLVEVTAPNVSRDLPKQLFQDIVSALAQGCVIEKVDPTVRRKTAQCLASLDGNQDAMEVLQCLPDSHRQAISRLLSE
ncbi:unnamed protein product [Pedinophyceae sp. YPF-701]|nr:unnamed protein product [Pedinophyceae sp. YPF-701]